MTGRSSRGRAGEWRALAYAVVGSWWPVGGADPGRKEGPRLGKAGDGHAVGRDGEKWVGGEYSLEEGAAHFPDGRDVGRRERSADGVTKLLGLSQCGGPPAGGLEGPRTQQVWGCREFHPGHGRLEMECLFPGVAVVTGRPGGLTAEMSPLQSRSQESDVKGAAGPSWDPRESLSLGLLVLVVAAGLQSTVACI